MLAVARVLPEFTFNRRHPLLPDGPERRRHIRYAFRNGLRIITKNGLSFQAITRDISTSGLSAFVVAPLEFAEEVRLAPLAGQQVAAVVRRLDGTVCGFEYIDPPVELVDAIENLCTELPPFRGTA